MQEIVLELVLGAPGAVDRLTPSARNRNTVSTAVIGVAASGDISEILELVEQEYDIAGIHGQCIAQLLLRSTVVIVEIAQRDEQPEI